MKEADVLSEDESVTLKTLAGYRNRMVHFYHEISEKELFEICLSQLSDIEIISQAIRRWINEHPTLIDDTL